MCVCGGKKLPVSTAIVQIMGLNWLRNIVCRLVNWALMFFSKFRRFMNEEFRSRVVEEDFSLKRSNCSKRSVVEKLVSVDDMEIVEFHKCTQFISKVCILCDQSI